MSENISKQKREELAQKIDDVRTYISAQSQDENTARLLDYLAELENVVRAKKYGLMFEEHREGIDDVLEKNIPVLIERHDLSFGTGAHMNYLIEGDNLAALKILERTNKNGIDLIYIDPPYNTGKNDFVYDDKFVDVNDTFNHSKWLSFMSKRLVIAQRILKDTGVIFISIDDNEQAALKLLCDDIFGASNFLACICVKGNPRGRQSSAYFAQVHDSLLVYRKKEWAEIDGFDIDDEQKKKRFNKKDDFGIDYEEWELRKRGADARREDSPNLWFPIYYNERTAEISTVRMSLTDIEITPKLGDGSDGRWRWSRDKVEREKSKLYVRATKSGGYNVYERKYLEQKSKQKAPTIWDFPEVNTELGTKCVKSILDGDGEFDFPKPVGLIMRILSLVKSDAKVLDFFAGSGTTGHAVMQKNAEDGGSRSFILCTNNQNDICRKITYERIKRAAEQNNYARRLKYYELDYIPIDEKLYYEYADKLLKYVKALVELENGIDYDNNREVVILTTESEFDEFIERISENGECKTVYLGHDVLPYEDQERILNERGITVKVVPEYYYKNE